MAGGDGIEIAYFGYNAFVVSFGPFRLVIDPGASLYLPDRLAPLIPAQALAGATHLLVTHGDPDHHWHSDRVARATGAALICNADMLRDIGGRRLMLGPRDRGLAFTTDLPRVFTLSPGEKIEAEGLQVRGWPGRHGPLPLPFGLKLRPAPGRRLGHGEMVFEIAGAGRRLVVFGDTVLLPEAWDGMERPDLALVPIGGAPTMTADEAAGVIAQLRPRAVVPCHYDCPALFSRAYNPVDPAPFCTQVQAAGVRCLPLGSGETALA